MRLFFWRKPRTIKVSERELELIRKAQAEAAGKTVEELDSDDNMPPTALNQMVGKRNGKGFKNLTFSGNLFETNLVDDINKRFEDSELIEKRKRS
ncbi:MAG: hypothetical protein RL488_24 [Actinomycetota bacterium]|jgi:hypothetical protein